MNGPLLCIDYGTKKCGLASSLEGFAFAIKTIPTSEVITEIKKLIELKKATAIIVGMPYNIDGSVSKHGKRVQDFAKTLKNHVGLPIILHDERLTTSEARIEFSQIGIEGDIDAEAARLILESYLEEHW